MFAGGQVDCEVAVKMLPRHASDHASREFMSEIELVSLQSLMKEMFKQRDKNYR